MMLIAKGIVGGLLGNATGLFLIAKPEPAP